MNQYGDGSQPNQGSQFAPASKSGLTGLILGIVSFFLPIPIVDVGLAIAGIVLSAKGLKEEQRGLAIAGLVVSILGLIASLLWNALVAIFAGL
jgi:hypothetical protein